MNNVELNSASQGLPNLWIASILFLTVILLIFFSMKENRKIKKNDIDLLFISVHYWYKNTVHKHEWGKEKLFCCHLIACFW